MGLSGLSQTTFHDSCTFPYDDTFYGAALLSYIHTRASAIVGLNLGDVVLEQCEMRAEWIKHTSGVVRPSHMNDDDENDDAWATISNTIKRQTPSFLVTAHINNVPAVPIMFPDTLVLSSSCVVVTGDGLNNKGKR